MNRIPKFLSASTLLFLAITGIIMLIESPVKNASGAQRVRDIPLIGGIQSLAVIPVKFKDSENTVSLSTLDEKVFTDLNKYFVNISYGRVSLTGEVAPQWYQLTRGEEWYGSGQERWESLVYDALRVADRDINYREYDFIVIVHTGENQDRTLQEEQVTSFGTYLRARFQTRDGTVIMGVSCLSEFDPIGPYAHYLALNMGLPRLYIDNSMVGEWGLMAHGFWANNGSTPVHPLSYSKVRAGWIDDSSVLDVEEGETKESAVIPLSSQSLGVKAVKIPISEEQYYLVEAREKIGYDRFLPDEGVLITYVDETKKSGEGVVKVIDGNPDTDTLDDAPLKLNGVYHNSSCQLTIKVSSYSDSSYNILVDRGGGSAVHNFRVETGVPGLSVTIDGSTIVADDMGVIQDDVALHEHTIEVPSEYSPSPSIRYIFSGWSDGDFGNIRTIDVQGDTWLKTLYSQQYLISVRSLYGSVEGGGWYDIGEKATISADPIIESENGTRRVFESWSGIIDSPDPQVEFTVNTPGVALAEWRTHFEVTFYLDGVSVGDSVLLTVNDSGSNLTQGETYKNWYPEEKILEFDVTPKILGDVDDEIVFKGFLDLKGENITSPLQITAPMEVVIQYSKMGVSHGPEDGEVEEAPEKARGFYSMIKSRIEDVALRSQVSLNAYIFVASPAVWAVSLGSSINNALPVTGVYATIISVAIIATLLGLIYLLPLAVGAVFWGCRRRSWKPRLKILTPFIILLFLGLTAALVDSLLLSATSIWGLLGLLIIGLSSFTLTSLGLTIILAKSLFKKNWRISPLIPG